MATAERQPKPYTIFYTAPGGAEMMRRVTADEAIARVRSGAACEVRDDQGRTIGERRRATGQERADMEVAGYRSAGWIWWVDTDGAQP